METRIVSIVKGKDTKGNDVAECVPHNVTLTIAASDQVAWGSFDGDFSVELVKTLPEGAKPLLLGGPWTGNKGDPPVPIPVNPNAKPGTIAVLLAKLTPSGAAAALPPNGSIMFGN